MPASTAIQIDVPVDELLLMSTATRLLANETKGDKGSTCYDSLERAADRLDAVTLAAIKGDDPELKEAIRQAYLDMSGGDEHEIFEKD